MNGAASMPGPVVVVGGINLDIQAASYGAFRRGDSNPGSVSMVPGGVGRNIAENLVRLGLATELVTVLGDDASSAMLRDSCARLGIGLSGALNLEGAVCSHYVCLLGPDGSLEGAVAAMDAFERLSVAFLETRRSLLDSASAIVVDANIPAGAIGWLAARYGRKFPRRGAGATESAGQPPSRPQFPRLFLDPVSAAKALRAVPFVGAFDCAKPNRVEAEVLAGIGSECSDRAGARDDPGNAGARNGVGRCGSRDGHGDDEAGLVPLARGLHGKGLGELFISLGASGLFYSDGSVAGIASPGLRPVFRSGPAGGPDAGLGFPPVVNVSGAGDAACAALVWASLAGYSLSGAAAFALAAAALCASSPFTVHPGLSAAAISEIAQGVTHEPLS